jgi:two-component system CheB/CheR fusion protein
MRTHLLGIELSPAAIPEAGEQLDAITKLVVQAIQKTRSLAVELSPPVLPNEGLQGVFNWLAAHMREMYNLDIELVVDERCELSDDDLRVLLFQIVRELLFNVVKHAGVLQALLTATGNDEHVFIRVEDNGAGFPDPTNSNVIRRSGFGLYSARERLQLFGGELTVDTGANKGTTITIMLPKNWKR